MPTAPIEQLPSNKLEPAEPTRPIATLIGRGARRACSIAAQPVSAATPTTPPCRLPSLGLRAGIRPIRQVRMSLGRMLEEGKLPQVNPPNRGYKVPVMVVR